MSDTSNHNESEHVNSYKDGIVGDANAPYGYCVDPNFRPNPLDVGTFRTDEADWSSSYDLKSHAAVFDGGRSAEARAVAAGHTAQADLPLPETALEAQDGLLASVRDLEGKDAPQDDSEAQGGTRGPQEPSYAEAAKDEGPTAVSAGADSPVGTVEEARGDNFPTNPVADPPSAPVMGGSNGPLPPLPPPFPGQTVGQVEAEHTVTQGDSGAGVSQ